MIRDIETLEDVKKMVNTFYGRVQKDALIGPIFNEKLEGKWDYHLEKMYSFWQTILLEEYTYRGRPFPPHAQLDVNEEHFQRWKHLFDSTVDEFFKGDVANEAKQRAEKMAAMFLSKINFIRNN